MADRVTGKPPNHQSARELLRWLMLAPIVFLILFGCGQLALGDSAYPADLDTRSKLQADYGAWPMVIIPVINPAIIEDIRRDENLNPTVVSGPFWPTPDRPTATLQPTLIAQRPTATPTRPAATSTPGNTPTTTPPSTRTSTPFLTRTRWFTATSTAWPTFTATPQPTITPRPPQSNTRTHTPTPVTPSETASHTTTPTFPPSVTAAHTSTSTPTHTPTNTATPSHTPTPTASLTPTRTPTPTETPIPTHTATATSTATSTPTPTDTPPPCSGSYPAGEPNAGLPNTIAVDIACGGELIIDLDALALPHITSHAGYDFVYYEWFSCGGICLDWVQVDLCDTFPCPVWLTVFNWGDNVPDGNSNVASFATDADGETDNEAIPAAVLQDNVGITLDVDVFGPPPASGYRYIRFRSPLNWPNNDGAQVDSIDVLP